MNRYSKNYRQSELKIRRIEATSDRLTGRAGLALFVAYLHNIEIFSWFDRWFASIRKNRKGIGITELFKQVLCFFVDGTSRRLTYFDQLSQDEGYAGSIETDRADMASSHQVKRFFKAFAWTRVFLFRRLLQTLFIWRLQSTRPDVIELGIDTMVMDNDDAQCRHGVKPTYKKKKGFQPLQMNWGRLIVDAVFRGGDKHSNHGDSVLNMIRHMVIKIKRQYRWDVPIVIRMDSGFFDQKIFMVCEALHVGYLCGGKMYKDIKRMAATWDDSQWERFESRKKEAWQYAEFGCRQGTWKRFRRAIFCRLIHNDRKQLYLPGFRPDTVIVTNIGQGQAIDWMLKKAGAADYLTANRLVACYHERGSDELANRAIKDFGHEQLPFKRFAPNAAWYYMMLVGHFLLESFKEDVSAPVISVGSYASTVRRRLIDIAGKIVFHSGETILKVSRACIESLRLPELFERCSMAPVIG
ncbi:IS1380 family transposase [Desulfosarcina sp.]|uniref:IS1380 family transposase n=1 Tax=Desulfosarcina sp. TaxID=2027861 RepID=UPI0029AB266F|nr:IS1380 family transposase [Desulfosarcina sp.]MDX2454855.1 IS1380 family transposase [Desulfosarcina sp.]MDX2492461.1 IS1380 family transposase [Desulfosarcina sp.]